jgi:hypothetical protein
VHVGKGPRDAISVHEDAESRRARVRQANYLHARIYFGHSAMHTFDTNHGRLMPRLDERTSECLGEAANPAAGLRRVFIAKEADVHGQWVVPTSRKNQTRPEVNQMSVTS